MSLKPASNGNTGWNMNAAWLTCTFRIYMYIEFLLLQDGQVENQFLILENIE